VIAALAAGRKAAISIDRYLQGVPQDSGRENEGEQTSPLKVEIEGIEKQTATKMPEVPPGSRISDMREVDLGYSVDQAAKEASRCLSCGCQICINKTGCPAISLVDEEVTIDKSQCPGCGLCAELCPAGAIKQ